MNGDDCAVIDTPIGCLGLRARSGTLVAVDFLEDTAEPRESPTLFLRSVAAQLAAYFHDRHAAFTLPLAETGTPYQRRVWRALATIPVGEARSYGQLARQVGGSARSVAAACKANPWPIVVPCHRVVAADGLGGYCGATAGHALEIKHWLLRHEDWHGGA